jgi:hypothetical protein
VNLIADVNWPIVDCVTTESESGISLSFLFHDHTLATFEETPKIKPLSA